ncbi:MAG: alkaline phosphatase D family protein [Pirellulaceae bacterium]|nr:alkaline phosphatase D family protein [Pirellulaceae bacterium]
MKSFAAILLIAVSVFSNLLADDQTQRAGEQIDLPASTAQTGTVIPEKEVGALLHHTHRQFPSVARLPVRHPGQGGWRIALTVTRLLSPSANDARRKTEDVGIWLDQGIYQVWWGAETMGGVRMTAFGKIVAENPDAMLSGQTHRIGLSVGENGGIVVSLDDKEVLVTKIDLPRRIGPIDLATRSSDVRWTDARGWNLTSKPADPVPEWILRKGEPSWHPEEGITNGYQPIKSHLWNRWLGNLLPAPGEWPTIPHFDGSGSSLVSHGPLLGKPNQHTVAIWCRTLEPMKVDVVAGVNADPSRWNVLGTIQTAREHGNSGHVVLEPGCFSPDRVFYSLCVAGKVLDIREDGRWPQLCRRWFNPESQKQVHIAVWCGDNLYPVPGSVYPAIWQKWQRDLDLSVHLGDYVYESAYRRRKEVSRLDYLIATDPQRPGGKRARHAPLVAVPDDHELFNDVTGLGEPHLFRAPPDDGTRRPGALPWFISSRDAGWAAWEEQLGWATPALPHLKESPIVLGRGTVSDGAIVVDDKQTLARLAKVDPQVASTLIIWPNGLPIRVDRRGVDRSQITPRSAGVYRFIGVDLAAGIGKIDPPAEGTDRVRFGIARPRYGSLRIGSAEVLLLDCRTMRTLWKPDPYDKRPTMLGKRQLEWLLQKIRTSPAQVLMIASSVTWKYHNSFTLSKRDSWTGYRYERDRIIGACKSTGKPVLLLSGDLHHAAVRKLDANVWEILCGAWSNQGFQPLEPATEDIPGMPNNGIMWSEPGYPDVKVHWHSYVTRFTIGEQDIGLEILNLSTDEVEFATKLPVEQ